MLVAMPVDFLMRDFQKNIFKELFNFLNTITFYFILFIFSFLLIFWYLSEPYLCLIEATADIFQECDEDKNEKFPRQKGWKKYNSCSISLQIWMIMKKHAFWLNTNIVFGWVNHLHKVYMLQRICGTRYSPESLGNITRYSLT